MKRPVLIVTLASISLVALAGCGASDSTKSPTASPKSNSDYSSSTASGFQGSETFTGKKRAFIAAATGTLC